MINQKRPAYNHKPKDIISCITKFFKKVFVRHKDAICFMHEKVAQQVLITTSKSRYV